jgi:chorismate synthase
MDSKKVIEKLIKIAENQQKIINKLAQQAQPMGGASSSWEDVTADLSNRLRSIPEAKGYSIGSAQVGGQTGSFHAELHVPSTDKMFGTVTQKLRDQLAGQTIKTNRGQSVKVTNVPDEITFVAALV